MDRRQFMTGAAAFGAATAVAPAARGVSAMPALHAVVADTRLDASIAFGEAAARRGGRVHVFDGDVGELWFDDLAAHFARGGAPIAGVGAPRTLLCLVELARGPGVRVLWRGEHRRLGDGRLRHELEGGSTLVARAAAVLRRAPDWRAALGDLLLADASPEAGPARLAVRAGAAGAPSDPVLASFVLAPRRIRPD